MPLASLQLDPNPLFSHFLFIAISSCAEHRPVDSREAVSALSVSHSNVTFWSREQSPALYLLSGHYGTKRGSGVRREEVKR